MGGHGLAVFAVEGLVSRWDSGRWTAGHAWVHIVADLAIFSAYTAIPLVLVLILRKYRELPYRNALWFCAALLASCGVVHLLEVVLFWHAVHPWSAAAKIVTAAVAWAALFALLPVLPKLRHLRTNVELEREVSHRQRAEQALLESEANYRSLVEGLPLWVFRKDRNFQFTFANDQFCESVGRTLEELLGKTDFDIAPPELAEKYRHDDALVIKHGKVFEDIEPNRLVDGRQVYVHILKVPVRDAAGTVIGIQGMYWDVTDRVEAEEALKRERHLLHSLMNNIPDSIYFKDRDSRFLRINESMADYIGLEHPRLAQGKTDHDFFAPSHADPALADEQSILHTGEPIVNKQELDVLRDGSNRWISTTKLPLRDEQGELIGTMGISRDITELKKTQDELQKIAEQTRMIVEAAGDAFVSMDADGKIIDWNTEAEKVFGWRRDAAIGRSVADTIIPPELRDAHTRGLANFLKTGTGPIIDNRTEIEALRRDGTRFPAEIVVSAIRWGDSYLFNAFLHDITARKAAEADLHAAKEAAEAANYSKSLFLANMSHEIRTPMNGILGMTELLMETRLSEEQQEFLRMIRESGETLVTVIEDILDFSKIEAGRLDLDHVSFALRESLGDTMKTMAYRAHNKGLELAVHVAPEVPEALVGDPRRLRQIVVNLVGNAVKFTDRGEVVVDVGIASQLDDRVVLQFSVRDTGIGIPHDKRDTIFNAFEQADMTSTRKYGGTGLGLAISARLVELLGGRIWVQSEPGQGAKFFFTAMFEAGDESGLARPTAARASVEGTRVLIVDDNHTNRRILEEMLRNWEMAPTGVVSSEAALAEIHAAQQAGIPYKLVLTDANMPDEDGFTLVERIRRDGGPAGPVIMMLTSSDQSGDVAKCEALSISAYLVKPVKQSELFDAIALALGIESAANEGDLPDEVAGISRRPLRVLLAEDSLVNQKVAVGLLSKWGHDVQVAGDGREAVAAYENGAFDLIIMDVQMPELDGLEATRMIRELEANSGRHVPILAMTAHAMKGDRERCLDAGMDEYIAKPIRARRLIEAIDRLLGTLTPAMPEPPAPGEATDVMDWSTALEAVDGDRDLLRDVMAAFLDECPRLVDEIRQAADDGDAPTLRRAAHTLKGSMRYFGATRAFDVAFELETMGRDGNLSEAPQRLTILQHQLDQLRPVLARFAGR